MLDSARRLRSQARRFENRRQPTGTRYSAAFRAEVVIHARGQVRAGVAIARIANESSWKNPVETAMYFHAHARRKVAPDRVVDGVALSPREFECLDWAAQGKTAWEIGRILGVSRRTAAFHLDNAKAKLGVHSISHAVARLITSRSMMQ